jgi:hypothetical protein
MRKTVDHKPVWVPAPLPVDADGNTRPGFVCVHVLENGGGTCGGSVFDPADEVGSHTCVVDDPNWLFPADRPGWLGEHQPWPCGSCGTEQDDSGPHSCVPPPPTGPVRSGQKCGDPHNYGCDIP